MDLSDSRREPLTVMNSRARLPRVAAPPPTGPPRFLTDLSLRAAPFHPGKSGDSFPLHPSPVAGFILFGRLATSTNRNEAEPGSLSALRLAGSPFEASRHGLRRGRARSATCRMGNLHGEFLSSHKISQTLPGAPKNDDPRHGLFHGIARRPATGSSPGSGTLAAACCCRNFTRFVGLSGTPCP